MLSRLAALLAIPAGYPQRVIAVTYVLSVVTTLIGAVALEAWWLAGIPLGLLVVLVSTADFSRLFFLMLACIPVSIEVYLPGGLGTDLPSEPLMWILTVCSIFWFLRHWRSIDARFFWHPITLGLLLHLSWMLITTVSSQDFFISFKFVLAKSWYVIVFFFLAGQLLDRESRYKQFFWAFFIPLAFTAIYTLVRHAAKNFDYEEANYVMTPFFRNHVMYACLLAIFLPFVWIALYWYKRGSFIWLILVAGILLFLVAINFAYTRAAYVALIAAIGLAWLIRRRWLSVAAVAFVLMLGIFVNFVATRDNWLRFAPDFERTITHRRFENLLEATTKLEDISTMERVYRWVAASYMVRERPVMGFGPGNFYFFYKNYTISSFKTYVSDNPERSGIHNYYFMTLVEQGFPGLLAFLIFIGVVMFQGQRIYLNQRTPWQKRITMAALLSFILINLLMLMNDFVETDKIGSLFFLTAAILVVNDLKSKDAD